MWQLESQNHVKCYHLSDDDLDLYSRGRLGPEESNRMEEHLLKCLQCSSRLASRGETVVVLRANVA